MSCLCFACIVVQEHKFESHVLSISSFSHLLTLNTISHSLLSQQYTTHKYHAKQNREVLNPYNVDKQLGLDVDALRRQNNPDNFTGEGWEMIMSGTKRCWRSPVRKMVFR